jgi:hypothetical protein
MATDKKHQTKQEQRQPETRQETAQAAAAPAGPTEAETHALAQMEAMRLSRDAALSELAEALQNKAASESLAEALAAQEQGKEERRRPPADVLTALKHLVRVKVPERMEESLRALIRSIFENDCMRGDRAILRSLTLLRDLLASDHLHGDAARDISKAIEALA